MSIPEAPKQYVEVRSIKPRFAREPLLTGRVVAELVRESLDAPLTRSVLDINRETGVISVKREIKIQPGETSKLRD